DLSEEMVNEASRLHPKLEFRVGDAETLTLHETFDVIIMADVIGHLLDVEAAFKRLHHVCTPETRIIVSYFNYLWEPVLRLGETLKPLCRGSLRLVNTKRLFLSMGIRPMGLRMKFGVPWRRIRARTSRCWCKTG